MMIWAATFSVAAAGKSRKKNHTNHTKTTITLPACYGEQIAQTKDRESLLHLFRSWGVEARNLSDNNQDEQAQIRIEAMKRVPNEYNKRKYGNFPGYDKLWVEYLHAKIYKPNQIDNEARLLTSLLEVTLGIKDPTLRESSIRNILKNAQHGLALQRISYDLRRIYDMAGDVAIDYKKLGLDEERKRVLHLLALIRDEHKQKTGKDVNLILVQSTENELRR